MANKSTGKDMMGCAIAIIGLFITTPIWYWLVYQILVRVNATPTMWVFFWIYMPVGIVLSLATKAMETLFSEKK